MNTRANTQIIAMYLSFFLPLFFSPVSCPVIHVCDAELDWQSQNDSLVSSSVNSNGIVIRHQSPFHFLLDRNSSSHFPSYNLVDWFNDLRHNKLALGHLGHPDWTR